MSMFLRPLLVLLGLSMFTSASAEVAAVAVASTLRHAFEEISPLFTRDTGHTLRATYGSSGNFYSQIRQGAPFDMFLAADTEFPDRLVREKHAMAPMTVYGEGRLVLMAPTRGPVKTDTAMADLKAALADGRLRKLAIANPALAPYGMRAQEALQHVGLWGPIQPTLVFGENVGQAAQFASTGSAQVAIVALSLALAPQLKGKVHYSLISASWHKPLKQGMVVINPESKAALALFEYMTSPPAQRVLKKYGYDVLAYATKPLMKKPH